jgi:hypothetical protein
VAGLPGRHPQDLEARLGQKEQGSVSNDTKAMVPSNGGTSIQRDGFGEKSIERRHETSSTAIAAAMRAEIEARYVMAMQRPRDDDQVRARLLKECKRPNFAAKAWYQVPRRGAKPGKLTKTPGVIEGLNVRFAEAAIRLAGNILQTTRITYDDDFKRLINVAATDLETNAVYSRDLVLEKTVERREPKDKDTVLGARTNSDGERVYIVQCTEEELLTKESNLVSRMFRTEALRFMPADTLEECERQVIETCFAEDKRDPDATKKAIVDTFATVNVDPADLKMYLGHDLGMSSPAELAGLRALFGAIRDGAVTWADALAEKQGETVEGQKTVEQKLAERKAAKAKVEAEKKDAPAAAQHNPGTGSATLTKEQAEKAGLAPNPRAPDACFYCHEKVGPDGVDHEDGEGVIWRKHSSCHAFSGPSR